MSSTALQPGAADWAAARGEKWSRNLDHMEATLRPIDAPLIDALNLDRPARIADIGCGGGGTTIEIARRAASGSRVHGFDISPHLIELARERAAREGAAISFDVADVATVTPEQPYARLCARFSLMFFDDAPAAFANLPSWLAPGGRFAFAVWGPVPDNQWLTRVREVVGRFAELPELPDDGPGPFRYAKPEKLLHLLERSGLGELRTSTWRGDLPLGGNLAPAAAARFTLASFSMFAELLARAGAEAQQAAERALTADFAEHQRADIIQMQACVHIITGVAPTPT
jgi:SAM-dependent methyltransferase